MILVGECAAGTRLPQGLSFSGFFQSVRGDCAIEVGLRKLYCCRDGKTETIELFRDYRKIIYDEELEIYYAYTLIWSKQKTQLTLYILDQYFKELDVQRLRADGIGQIEDMWLDQQKRRLLFVFSSSIQVFNLNGDSLGTMMTSPMDTRYQAACTVGDALFLAYERDGSVYIAEYDHAGVYKSYCSIGSSYEIESMQAVQKDKGTILLLYGKKKRQIAICLEISLDSCERAESVKIEVVRGEGIGEATCFIDSLDRGDESLSHII